MSAPIIAVVIVAAGSGSRMGAGKAKQYRMLGGKMLLTHTLSAFSKHPDISLIQPVISTADEAEFQAASKELGLLPAAPGGKTRQESVYNGLEALSSLKPDYVLIHDAARPFVQADTLDRIIAALKVGSKAVLPALPVVDTLKRVQNNTVGVTVARDELYRAQTPQAFVFNAIYDAHQSHIGKAYTDDIALMEACGTAAIVVDGDEDMFKVTHEADFTRAEELIMARTSVRLGKGFDVHAFEDGDAVILCGVSIPHDKALQGHSDADVAMHALTDALYGAMAEGDIGVHFPPSDDQWKGAESKVFLRHAMNLLRAKGGSLNNADLTIICEAPKIAPHQAAMRASLSAIMDVSPSILSVKATTTEKLGFTGRGEGIAADAIVSVSLPKDD